MFIEVLAFALPVVRGKLEELGIASAPMVKPDGEIALTDHGNPVLAGRIGPIADPAALEHQLVAIPGVVGTGLFIGLADTVIVQDGEQVEVRQKPALG